MQGKIFCLKENGTWQRIVIKVSRRKSPRVYSRDVRRQGIDETYLLMVKPDRVGVSTLGEKE
jgi:hypothetical protein